MNTSLPFVTVILPIRNEEPFIQESLSAILEQDYPQNRLEVIIADGMSSDKTRLIASGLLEKHPKIQSRIIDNHGLRVPSGFNSALEIARGDIIIRVDGHCTIQSNYITRCVELINQTGADNVGGIQLAFGQSKISHAIAMATSSRFGVGNAKFHYATEGAWADTVFLGAYRKSVFARLGGFDINMACNEDDEFNFRLLQSGGKIWLAPDLKTKYYVRSSWAKLFNQYYRYGFYKVLVIRKRRGIASIRHLVPSFFVLSLSASIIGGFWTGFFLPLMAIASLYLGVTLAASMINSKGKWREIPYLALAFWILHIAYGSGFTLGLAYWPRVSLPQPANSSV